MSLFHDPEDGSSSTVLQKYIEAVSSQDGLCLLLYLTSVILSLRK